MAGIRDPAFWKRFSVAVHMDEEKANPAHANGAASPASSRPSELKHSYVDVVLSVREPTILILSGDLRDCTVLTFAAHRDTWLERNAKKRKRMRCIGWSISLGLVVIIAAIVLVVLWLKGSLFATSSTSPAAATATSIATPTSTAIVIVTPPGTAR
jgi:hypothetical protein